MMKNSFKLFAGIILLLAQLSAYATEGNLFKVISSGTPALVDITLCLNGKAKLSCEDEKVTALDLVISTTVPNRTYPDAGIFVNTPGYSIASLGIACSMYDPSGYCIFGVSSTSPASISLTNNVVKTPQFAYIGNNAVSQIVQCVVNTNGSFGTCAPIEAPDNSGHDLFNWNGSSAEGMYPATVAFNPAGTIAYIATSNHTVIQCNVNATTGLFSNCTVPYSYPSLYLQGISVNEGGTYAYISPVDNPTQIIVCAIDGGNLNGSSCTLTTANAFNYPTNVLFNSTGNYAYVGQGYDVTEIFLCEVGMTGDLSSCSAQPVSGAVAGPSGLAFNADKSIMYVANNYYSSHSIAPLSKCTVTGQSLSCTSAIVDSSASVIDVPERIVVNSAGEFVYLTDYNANSIIGCRINASSGALSNCTTVASNPTPYSLFYQPVGITLLN
jgi:6-phosphogluconolactonase (cycloisomerase 2 family)